MSQSIDILEYTRVTKAREIDEERGILYGLVVLGSESQNGREYPESTQRKLLPLIEGRQCFANHARGGAEPSIYDVLGVWSGGAVQGGKTYADFHYFKSHPLAGRLVEAARRPELNNALGFSISAKGSTRYDRGKHIVEGFDRLNSIDCVAQPATVRGVYESRGDDMAAPILTLRALTERLAATRPRYAAGLREAAASGIMAPDAPVYDAPDAPPDGDHGADHERAILDACKACIDDMGLSPGEKLVKIRKMLKLVKGNGGDDMATAEDDTDESVRAAQPDPAVQAQLAELARLKARDRLRSAADEAGIKLPRTLLEHIDPAITDEQAKALAAELREAVRPTPPPAPARRPGALSAPPPKPVVISAGGNGSLREGREQPPANADAKTLAAWVQNGG